MWLAIVVAINLILKSMVLIELTLMMWNLTSNTI